MRWISFGMTEAAILTGIKTETRRLGWANMKEGERLLGVRKGQGRKAGEDPGRLAVIVVKAARRESLDMMLADHAATAREGMPSVTPRQFVNAFCEMNDCKESTVVTVIRFAYERWLHRRQFEPGEVVRGSLNRWTLAKRFTLRVIRRLACGVIEVEGLDGWPRPFKTCDEFCCPLKAEFAENRFEELVVRKEKKETKGNDDECNRLE